METTAQNGSSVITINNQHRVYSIAFADDGKHVLSGGVEGMLRRWRVDDGHEIDRPIRANGAKIYAVAVSPNGKWLVCGLKFPEGNRRLGDSARAGVWDAETHEKVLHIYGHTDSVLSVHISSDSSKFATGGSDKLAFIWSLTTGEQLVGPLRHDGWVVAVRFSPNSDYIATATAENPDAKSIRIYDSESGHQLLDVPFHTKAVISSSLAWSADGGQFLAVSHGEAKCFDTPSGSLHSTWTVPGKGQPASIALARNGKFIVVSSYNTLSFWDAFTRTQIGDVIKHTSVVWSIALSPDDDCIATGEDNGRVTFRGLRDILPDSYFSAKVSDRFGSAGGSNRWSTFFIYISPPHILKLPFMYISDAVLKQWTQGELTRVEELLTDEIVHPIHDDPLNHARALAHRALVRTRLKQWNLAVDDAKKSIETRRSVIGHIASASTYVRNRDHESAMRVFDLVFTKGLAIENDLLLLIKAIVLFECGQRHIAISRVNDLIDVLDDQSMCISVRAQMFLLLGEVLLKGGDSKQATELLGRAQEAIPLQKHPHMLVISLIFGWDFDGFDLAAQQRLQECFTLLGGHGDAAVSGDPNEAVRRYSAALSLRPPNPANILINRSEALATLGRWEDALKDADKAIEMDPLSPWGYKRRHAALHSLQRYDEAIDAFSRMFSLIKESPDPDARELGKRYVSPSRSVETVDNAVHRVSKSSPIVLIDVKSGRLCDRPERMQIFKSELQFKELVSSMTQELDNVRIQDVVGKFFLYVTFSHVWDGKEPLFQDVNLAGTVWDLDSSRLNEKLRKFCEVVRDDGYRWAWSDTCCIDKTNGTVLNQSLTAMYKWYEASAATFVFLRDVELLSSLVGLKDSVWMTRAWTSQELLAPKVVRFYDRNWKPYLDDTRTNHKDSPEVMQELTDAIGLARQTIVAFNPDYLSVREKLRLASTRKATVEEDIAYSLIGIFKSDIIPRYGEGDAALGHLLEEIVARSGEVMVLAWTGEPSSYNSCLPAALTVYSRPPFSSPIIEDAEMDTRVAALKDSLSETDITQIYERVTHLPPARFANRRLHLPCIIFGVKRLGVQDFGSGHEYCYRARASGIGDVEFQTSEQLPLAEPGRFIFVHPWIRELRDPLHAFTRGNTIDDDDEDDSDSEAEVDSLTASPLHAVPTATMDCHTLALRLVVRLQQPFQALLLQQQHNGEFKRVAAEHEIVVPGIKRQINFASIRTEVVEIL